MTRGVRLLIAVCCIAACSGSDQAVTTSTIEPSEPITAPETTAGTTPQVTTTDPAVDATTTTTEQASTTTITTEPAPTTTTLEDLRAEIEADLNERERIYLQAGADPGNPNVAELLSLHNGDAILDRVLALMDEFVRAGSMLRPSPVIQNRVEVLSVLEHGPNSATVSVCRIDAAIEFVPAHGEVDETILDASVGRFITTNEMAFDGTNWRMLSGDTTDSSLGDTSCVA